MRLRQPGSSPYVQVQGELVKLQARTSRAVYGVGVRSIGPLTLPKSTSAQDQRERSNGVPMSTRVGKRYVYPPALNHETRQLL